MDRSPLQILETVNAAQSVMENLHARASAARNFHDVGDLSVIQTTVKKIEELLEFAGEYADILQRQLERTNARLASSSP